MKFTCKLIDMDLTTDLVIYYENGSFFGHYRTLGSFLRAWVSGFGCHSHDSELNDGISSEWKMVFFCNLEYKNKSTVNKWNNFLFNSTCVTHRPQTDINWMLASTIARRNANILYWNAWFNGMIWPVSIIKEGGFNIFCGIDLFPPFIPSLSIFHYSLRGVGLGSTSRRPTFYGVHRDNDRKKHRDSNKL